MPIQKKSLINKHVNVKKAVIAKSTSLEPTTVEAKRFLTKSNSHLTKSNSHLTKSNSHLTKMSIRGKMAIQG